MLASGTGAATCMDLRNTSRLALLDSKLALSNAKLERRDLPLLVSDALLSLLLRFNELWSGEEAPVMWESPSLPSAPARECSAQDDEVFIG